MLTLVLADIYPLIACTKVRVGRWDLFLIPPLCTMRILNPIDNCFLLKNGLQIIRIQEVGIAISSADRWFPTTSQKHSAKNKIDISGGTGENKK